MLRESSLLVLALQLASLVVCMLGSSVTDHPLALTGSADGLRRCVYVSVYTNGTRCSICLVE